MDVAHPENTRELREDGKPVGKPFQAGNPGRPKGARNKLGEQFIKAMLEDFEKYGVDAIATVRDEKPDQYIKVIASILPKEIEAGEQLAQFLKESRDAAVAAAFRADS